jgi:tight adherence protein B
MVFDPLAAVAALSVLATVMVGLFAFYGNAVPASNVRGRIEGLMSGASAAAPGQQAAALRAPRIDTGMLAKVASANIAERLTQQLERADMTLSPGEYIVIRLALAGIGFVIPFFFIQGVIGWLLMLVAAVIGYNLPKIYMNRRRKSRVAMLNAQLPEALTMISNSLKAGFGLLQSLSVASEQLQHPISTEFSRTIHEMNIGSGVEEAMLALGERSDSYDLDMVITAILVQRTVGGNLGEILDNVAGTMRERIRIRGEIETLTAQQKLTGIVIGLLPIAIGILFSVISPGYINPLFTTVLGKVMLVVAVVLEVLGIMIIQRIMDIEV